MEQSRDKPTLLSRLPPLMLRKLNNSFNSKYCNQCRSNHFPLDCPNFKPKQLCPNIVNIYGKYNHGRLEEYSDDDIRAYLDAFKKTGNSEGKTSEFYQFVNYETYLET